MRKFRTTKNRLHSQGRGCIEIGRVSESTELVIGRIKIWKSRKPTQEKGVSCTEFHSRLPAGERNQKPHPIGKADALVKRSRQPNLQNKPTVLSSNEST